MLPQLSLGLSYVLDSAKRASLLKEAWKTHTVPALKVQGQARSGLD